MDNDRVDRIYAAIMGAKEAGFKGTTVLNRAIEVLTLWGIDAENSPNGLHSIEQTFRKRRRLASDLLGGERGERTIRFTRMATLILRGNVVVTDRLPDGTIVGSYCPSDKRKLIIRQGPDGMFELRGYPRTEKLLNESNFERLVRNYDLSSMKSGTP
jgi:hypothetical protein